MPFLCIDSGSDKGKKINLEGDVVIVGGRQEGLSFTVNDSLVSSKHFRIMKNDDLITIEDLGSTNGTFLNGERIESACLSVGDVLQVGDTYISVQEEAQSNPVSGRQTREIAGYEVLEKIGVGGMGIVYRARQLSLDREVALKVLSKKFTSDPVVIKKFISEARSAGQLTHSNVVQVHDVGDENGVFFIAMEFISGGNLADLLREQGRLGVDTAIRIATDVARGLEYAETKSIVHCDIKPENVMLTDTGVAKIADLGIARRVADQTTGTLKEVFGSPHYMAPEQAQGKPVDCRTDLYALGCTLYRVLAGRTPFSGATAREIMKKQVTDEPQDIQDIAPEVDDELADVVHTLMEKDPEKRYQHANDVVVALESASQAAEAKQKGKSKKGLPKPIARPPVGASGALRTTTRIRRQKDTSSIPFMPFAIVMIVIGFCVVAVILHAAPDKGARALIDAQALYDQGNYEGALLRLRQGSGTRSTEVAKKIDVLEKNIERQLNLQKAEQAFQLIWNKYKNMKADGTDNAALRTELDRILKMYGHIPEKKRIIEAELGSL